MRAVLRRHCAVALAAFALSIAWTNSGVAGGAGTISAAGGTLVLMGGGGHVSSGTFNINNGSTTPGAGGSTPTSPSAPWATTSGPNEPNTPLNLSGSSESGSGGGGSSGGGLVWGDPLSADIGNFGKVHTQVHYFSQSGYNNTQQAVGINFSIRY